MTPTSSFQPARRLAFGTILGLAVLPLISFSQQQLLPLRVKVGEHAPDFVLTAADGKTVRLSDFAGHSVLIDFYRGYW